MDESHPARRWRWARPLGLVGLGLTLLLLLAHAWVYAFLTDDAFISFRYARNLSDGYGLVFNPGFERVEGYTNFLWVLLLAGLNTLGLIPELAAHVLSIAATVALWGSVVWFAWRSAPRAGRRWWVLTAPLCLAATRSVAVWSTSGLETRLFEVLVLSGALRLVVEVESRLAGRPRRPVAVLLFALATLTRPDGLLVSLSAFAVTAGQLALRRRLNIPAFAREMAFYAMIVGGHFAFRFAYYGDWLPNTYYAKVYGQTWWDMGFVYLGAFALEYAAYLWIPLLVAAVYEHRAGKTLFVPGLFAAIVLPHMLYVISIGGDYFEYRPLDLYFPFVFLLLHQGVRRLARGTVSSVVTAGYLVVVLVGLVALPLQSHREFPDFHLPRFPGVWMNMETMSDFMRPQRDPIYHLPGLRHLARAHLHLLRTGTARMVGIRQEEQRMFLAMVVPEGRKLRKMVDAGLLPPDTYVALQPAGAIPYYSDLRVMDFHGLTDRYIAHSDRAQPERSMAHDKMASLDYIARAGVDLALWAHGRPLLNDPCPGFVDCLKRILAGIRQGGLPTYVAHTGNDHYLFVLMPQGIEHVRRKLPKLRFRPLTDPELQERLARLAVRNYCRRLQKDPEDHLTRMALVEVLLFLGDAAAALEVYAHVAPPDVPRIWYNLSVAHQKAGDPARAVEFAEQALRLARSQADRQMIAKLERWLARCRSLDPTTTRSSSPSR